MEDSYTVGYVQTVSDEQWFIIIMHPYELISYELNSPLVKTVLSIYIYLFLTYKTPQSL